MRNRLYLTALAGVTAASLVAWRASASPTTSPLAGNAKAPVASPAQGLQGPATAGAAAAPSSPVAAPAAAGSPEVASLQRDLERLISAPNWPSDAWSVMVVSLDRGDTLFAHGPADLLAPASNMKV